VFIGNSLRKIIDTIITIITTSATAAASNADKKSSSSSSASSSAREQRQLERDKQIELVLHKLRSKLFRQEDDDEDDKEDVKQVLKFILQQQQQQQQQQQPVLASSQQASRSSFEALYYLYYYSCTATTTNELKNNNFNDVNDSNYSTRKQQHKDDQLQLPQPQPQLPHSKRNAELHKLIQFIELQRTSKSSTLLSDYYLSSTSSLSKSLSHYDELDQDTVLAGRIIAGTLRNFLLQHVSRVLVKSEKKSNSSSSSSKVASSSFGSSGSSSSNAVFVTSQKLLKEHYSREALGLEKNEKNDDSNEEEEKQLLAKKQQEKKQQGNKVEDNEEEEEEEEILEKKKQKNNSEQVTVQMMHHITLTVAMFAAIRKVVQRVHETVTLFEQEFEASKTEKQQERRAANSEEEAKEAKEEVNKKKTRKRLQQKVVDNTLVPHATVIEKHYEKLKQLDQQYEALIGMFHKALITFFEAYKIHTQHTRKVLESNGTSIEAMLKNQLEQVVTYQVTQLNMLLQQQQQQQKSKVKTFSKRGTTTATANSEEAPQTPMTPATPFTASAPSYPEADMTAMILRLIEKEATKRIESHTSVHDELVQMIIKIPPPVAAAAQQQQDEHGNSKLTVEKDSLVFPLVYEDTLDTTFPVESATSAMTEAAPLSFEDEMNSAFEMWQQQQQQ